MIDTHRDPPPKRQDPYGGGRAPSGGTEELDDESSGRIIPPGAFEPPGRLRWRGRKGLSFVLGLVIIVVAVMVFPKSGGDEEQAVQPPTSTQPIETPTPSTPSVTRPSVSPIGRLVVVTDLPGDAWLEIDGKAKAPGLGIDFPLRVAGGISHRVSVHARGYRPWESEIFVPVDSLVRFEVSLEPLPSAQRPAPTTQQRTQPPPTQTRPQPPPQTRPVTPSTGNLPGIPNALLDSLTLRLEQGRTMSEIGRYFDAADAFQDVLTRLDDATTEYRRTTVTEALRARVDSALVATRAECRAAGRDRCP